MTRTRLVAAGVATLSAAIFVVSGVAMFQRVKAYNATELPERPYFMPVEATEFTFANRPVRFEYLQSAGETPNTIRVTYGDADPINIRETIPNEISAVPDLRRHEEWLRVFRMIMIRGTSIEEALEAVDRDELNDRLVMVVLRPPAGADTGGWGRIWTHEYRFDLYEFTENGSIVLETLKYPSKRNPGDPVPEGELAEGTWQYDAAMESMPPVYRAEPVDNQNASLALGWTFPVAGTSSLAGMVALIVFMVSGPRKSAAD